MKQTVRLTERIHGRYEHVPPILRLEFDHVIREPLDELRVHVGGGFVGRRAHAEIGPVYTSPQTPDLPPRTLEIPLSWQASEHPALFPTLHGRLRIGDAGRDLIELRLDGEYTPPLGAVGSIADRFAGHRAATASLRGYLLDVAHRLEAKLVEHAPPLSPRPHRLHLERSP